MASTTMTVTLLLAFCALFITVSPAAVRPDNGSAVGYCFRQRTRTPNGRKGLCTDKVQPVNGTVLDAEGCCSLGGEGWSVRKNGKRCFNACEEMSPVRQQPPSLLDASILEDKEHGLMKLESANDKVQQNVDGDWSSWSNWTECSDDPCALKISYRSCDNPPPSAGGSDCTGQDTKTEQCYPVGATISLCPVDGGWTEWSAWIPCSAICLAGYTVTRRFRECSNPHHANGGKNCKGSYISNRVCMCSNDGDDNDV